MKKDDADKRHLVDGKYGIGDMVDIDQLRRIFERFSEATGFTIGFLDHPGMNILIAAGWRDICTRFHRGCPASEAICLKSNRHLLDQLDEPGKVLIEACEHGLVDCATPIIIKGKHVASLATGQLFLKKPDLERFKRQARIFGFDEQAYLKAIEVIPVVSERELRIVTALLGEIAMVLSHLGYTNLIVKEESRHLANEITERRRLEGELEREWTQTLSIFDQMAAEVSILDPQTREILFMNRYARELYGQGRTGSFCYEVFHGSRGPCPSCNNELLLGMKDGESIQREVFSEPIGRHYLTTNNLIHWHDGRRVKLEISIDITDKKQAERALKDSESRYQFLAESMADVVFTLDLNLMTTYVSPSIERMLGYTPEERMAQKVDQQLTPKSMSLVLETLAAELDREKEKGADPDRHQVLELEYHHKDGSTRQLATYLRGIRDGEGNLTGVYGSHHDITERKRAEEALREQGIKMSSIFRAAPVGIGMVIQRVIWEANDMLCSMTGYSRGELLGQSARVLYPTEADYDYVGQEKYRQIGEKNIGTVETRWKKKDGEIIHVILSSTPLDPDDHAKGVTFTALDISERKQAEEERRILEERLRQADKMEAIGTLAGGIAHDFNNLLMGIQGYASLTLMDLDPSHPHHERLKRIEEQVQSGADLTRQLLGFARGGRYEVRPADMNEIVQKSSSMFGRTRKEITIHRKYAADLRNVEVDRGQMEQVFMNLYVNAWQAMPGGGEICLETGNVLLGEADAFPYSVTPGEYVRISVTDTGTGMDEKTRARIFDPFFTTKGMGRGTGLGLATVYGIIKGHKGMIQVESEPGRGTTFSIYLPASEKVLVKEEREEGQILKGTETILIADDEKMVLEVSREMLEFLGYRVYLAGSGQEAIAVYLEKRENIDLVILDMIMPGMSGGETFDRLRGIDPDARVLLSSGYSIDGEAKTIMERGCNGFIQKPFQLEKLSWKIREMLD